MNNHILYSYRRCPYALRARLTLCHLGIPFELREVDLKNKPQHMLEASPKGTVPVLVKTDGEVIDESLDIIMWAIEEHPDSDLAVHSKEHLDTTLPNALEWIEEFRHALARVKFPEKYADEQLDYDPKEKCNLLLSQVEKENLRHTNFICSNRLSIIDIILFPHIHKFAMFDPENFDSLDLLNLKSWHHYICNGQAFTKATEKHSPWQEGNDPVVIS